MSSKTRKQSDSHLERRLVSIMAADVAGYSRLMAQNDERTLSMLVRCRRIFSANLGKHEGRLFGMAGDSVMSEFSSPLNAVRAAIATQQRLKTENARLPEDQRMEFRIGINLGDVIKNGPDLFGDGVNIAARLQEIALRSGICITRAVYEQVKGKIGSVK